MNGSGHAVADRSLLDFSWFSRLPLVTQTETTECGIACLAMIARYHGSRVGLVELRRRFHSADQGVTLRQLAELASQLGFLTRPLRVALGAVAHLQRPCILHWNLDHFVVLKSVRGGQVVIHDPAVGLRKLPMEALSRHFTGVALELAPSDKFLKEPAAPSLRLTDLWTRITGLRRRLAQVLALSLLLQLFAIAAPFYMQIVVDDVVLRRDSGLLTTLALGFLLLLVIEAGTRLLRTAVILQLSSQLHLQLAANLFDHLIRLPMRFFQQRHPGDILSRFSSLESIREILSVGMVSAVVDGVMASAMLIIMLLYNSQLTLVVLVALIGSTAIRFALFPALRRLSLDSIGRHAAGESHLIESIRAIQSIKLFQQEGERSGIWQNRLADALNADIRIARLGMGLDAVNTLLFGIENILVIYMAAKAVMSDALSLGMVFAFMSYKQRLVSAAERLLEELIEIRMMGLHLNRVADIALTEPDRICAQAVVRSRSAENHQPLSLSCRGLSYRHNPYSPWVFRDIDLAISAGENIAIAGPSGVGKSTLLKCLMGLVPATEGEILIDGIPIHSHRSHRSLMAAVMQDDQLLSGSIADNICCFDPHPHLDRIAHCARLACIHGDIMRLPMQYNTPVGDTGSAMSGGQTQRILLARALYRQPAMLFLDEATSHLDTDTESAINRHIAALRVTRVMVAHRQDTLALADRVIQLQPDGRATLPDDGR